ncbi:MAG: hypothetical protein HOV81_26080 [Kofleriaceae bacterium]|nr:hypothetical protein [Kofleriaceae bacterium]
MFHLRRGHTLAVVLALLGGCVRLHLPKSKSAAPALAPLPDEGMTNATHERFVGQIVFSSEPISKTSPDEMRFAAEFFADEPLYARAYLPHSVENEPVFVEGDSQPLRNRHLGYFYKLKVDGKEVPYLVETGNLPPDSHATTTRSLPLHPTDEPTARGWVELVNKLAPGRHVLRFELWSRDGSYVARNALAAGEVVLHKDGGIATGRTFDAIATGLDDAQLAAQLLEIARAYAKREAWKDTQTDLKVTSREWKMIYGRMRVLAGRELVASVRSEWPDGHCTAQTLVFSQRLKITREPDGPIGVKGVGDQELIDCAATTAAVAGDRWAGKTRARPTPTSKAETKVVEAKPAETQPVATTAVETKTETKPVATAAVETKPVATSTPVVATRDPLPTAVASAAPVALERRSAERAGRFSLGLGAGMNGLDPSGVATYANVGVHLGRFQIGAGATWPLDALGYVRFAMIDGRFELSPMIAVSVLAEQNMDTRVAFAGGVSMAFALVTGVVSAGLRLDVLASFDGDDPTQLAVPVLGSTFVRF